MRLRAQLKKDKNELKNRLVESGQTKPPKPNMLTNLPSVQQNSKGRPNANKGLQFRPQRNASTSALQQAKQEALQQTLNQPIVQLGRKQSAYLAGASRAVEDPFTDTQINRFVEQKTRMFQGIDEVQQAEDIKGLGDEKDFVFKVASVSLKRNSSAMIPNQGKEWTQDLQNQLSRFKNSQKSKMFNINEESTFNLSSKLPQSQAAPGIGPTQGQSASHANLPKVHPQFQANNLEPYSKRPQTSMRGPSPLMQTLNVSQSLRQIQSNQLTPSGANRHLPKRIKEIRPSQTGQIPNSQLMGPSMMAHSQSEAFFQAAKQSRQGTAQTQKRVVRMIGDRKPSQQSQATIKVFPEQHYNPQPTLIAQSEAAEEVLRQHYYIAKATKRTHHQVLEKEMSPQKHIVGSDRLSNLDQIQVQAASLMRLNAVWGHEKKDIPIDLYKAFTDSKPESGDSGVYYNVLPEAERFLHQDLSEPTDLEMMISLFMRQPQDNGYFIYLVQGDPENPFDLKPMIDYIRPNDKQKSTQKGVQVEVNSDRYFTLSKKGITSYVDGKPEDYEPLQDWILARTNYRQIRSFPFFKNFKRWKIIRKWFTNVKRTRRQQIKAALEEKLFLTDEVFSDILLKHRKICKSMELFRVIDLKVTDQASEDQRLEFFMKQQREKQDRVCEKILEKSNESRKLFQDGIDLILNNLKKEITQTNEDADVKDDVPTNQMNNETTSQFARMPREDGLKQAERQARDDGSIMAKVAKKAGIKRDKLSKQAYNNPALIALGFQGQMKYGDKSKLRKSCSRFLRFSYLMDFIATEALTNIYILSVKESIERLQSLSLLPVDNTLNPNEDHYLNQESHRSGTSQQEELQIISKFQAQPFLLIDGKFDSEKAYFRGLPTEEKEIDLYLPPPMGLSTVLDFNPTCHLKIAKKRNDDEEENPDDDEIEDKVKSKFVINPDREFLTVEPSCLKLQEAFENCLLDGKQCLHTFVRWSKHNELNKYQAVLETWDDRVCDVWEPLVGNKAQLNCDEWLKEDQLYKRHTGEIQKLISDAYEKVDKFYEQYNPLLQMFWQNCECGNFDILKSEELYEPIQSIETLLKRYQVQKVLFEENLPEQKDIGMFRLNTAEIKEKFKPQTRQCLEILKNVLPQEVERRILKQSEWLKEQIAALDFEPKTVDSFVKQIQTLDYIDLTYQQVKDKIILNEAIFGLCTDYELVKKGFKNRKFIDDKETGVNALISKLNKKIHHQREAASNKKESVKQRIKSKVPKLNKITDDFLEELEDQKYLDISSDINAILAQIEENEALCTKVTTKRSNIQKYQRTLDMAEINQFPNVEKARHLHMHTSRLWRALHDWQQMLNIWENTVFANIKVQEITDEATKYTKIVLQCEKNLPSTSTAVHELKKLVYAFKDTMPVVLALANEKLDNTHWEQIKKILDLEESFPLQERQMTLGKLIELDFARKKDEIQLISTTATQESILNKQMTEIKTEFEKEKAFSLDKHSQRNDAYKIMNFGELQLFCEESLLKMSEIVQSRFNKRYIDKITTLFNQLMNMSEVLEEWKKFQNAWLYLENVYQNPDLKNKKADGDQPDFQVISGRYCRFMSKTVVSRSRISNYSEKLDELKQDNKTLDKIIKYLEEYLEKKREEQPRFYFLSNDELLQLLANQSDIASVNPHMNKCFDNVKALIFSEGQIDALISNEGETLNFSKPVKMTKKDEGIETVLQKVESEMQAYLIKNIKSCFQTQSTEMTTRKDWVISKHLCQVVSVTSLMLWSESTAAAIWDMEENPLALEDALKQQEEGLKNLVDLIKTDLTIIQRRTVVSLITQEVHCRDILEQLYQGLVDSQSDFRWQQQLRYVQEYVEIQDQKEPAAGAQAQPPPQPATAQAPAPPSGQDQTKSSEQPEQKKKTREQRVAVKQVNASLPYGYEYMGATSRLIITPLTDKCWLTITGALHIKLSASPSGPAGTGKTESTKDLAKALGYLCVVFNCSDQVEYKIMQRIFSGVIRTGAWACLDEFNRIEVEVLSVIAQQLQEIRQAKLQQKIEFDFCEKTMKLRDTCGVFVTMNPGYAGRTELPDNLKVLFRPVAMMIPSYQLIAEVMLFAEGFNQAKKLSAKMVKLYKLSSEQLSQQDHYDFGMRAVKSVLVMAGNLKRQNPHLSENELLIRAMRDANVPKFLSEDLPLFNALITDLFPGVKETGRKTTKLDAQILKTMEEMKLMRLDSFTEKVSQLNDTLIVRFGVMIVGPTNGGKTTCYKVLQHAITEITEPPEKEDEKDPDIKYGIKTKVINPKSISMGELYGQEDKDTKEWTDGLASKNMRKFAGATDHRMYWVVFDGPVDALWIENMNTVLDDNMTLCLASGERIMLRTNMHLIFEVQDLAVASPATVSRCGMVYMSPTDLGWRPYYQSWLQRFVQPDTDDAKLDPVSVHLLNELFEQIIDPLLEKLSHLMGEQALPMDTAQMIANACDYLEYFLLYGHHPKVEDRPLWIRYINCIFGFSIIWACGAHFKQTVSRFTDVIFRDFFARLLIPNQDTVFEYFFDERTCKFEHWKTVVPSFEYPSDPNTTFFDLIVPTIETQRYAGHLSFLTKISKPVYITGSTGTGKSMIVQNFIRDNHENLGFISIILNFSAQTDSQQTQATIEGKLEKKRKKSRGAKGTLKTLIFIDDINMPQVEEYGAQPPIELLRQLIERKGFYDRQQLFWKEIEKFTVMAAAAPPSGGRSALCPRFMRRFHIFQVPEAQEDTLTLIFESILGGFLVKQMFNEKLRRNQPDVAVSATIDLYTQIIKNLLPIPAKFFYTFNLRDISKVFQGLLQCNPIQIQTNEQFGRLWLHEVSRVFGDRLITNEDKNFFEQLCLEICQKKFKASWATTVEEVFTQPPIFSIILRLDFGEREDATYDFIEDQTILVKKLQDVLIDYNCSGENEMNLVFFNDAVNYLCAIVRVLNQPKGNAMLIGVSGSGKQSLTKLATSILEHKKFSLQLSKNFKPKDFKETLKEEMLNAGCDLKPATFIMTDSQIMYESFLEDINNILNTGEITNLYKEEDKKRIAEAIDDQIKQAGITANMTYEEQYAKYIQQLQANFHVILAMSPVGDALRIRCRMFPSLVNCCILIWFSPWPIEALKSVATQNLQEVENIPQDKLLTLFPQIHASVEACADQFFLELRRKTYITPKSFLDCMTLFLELLEVKRTEHQHQLSRLENGVKKLKQTNEQIEALQITLTELKPKLVIQEEQATLQAGEIKEKKEVASQQETEAENDMIEVKKESVEIEQLKQEAEQELSIAMPALQAASAAVDGLQKSEVDELRTTKQPTSKVEITLRCVMAFFGQNKYDWPSAQKMMADMGFLNKLKSYDKENIPQPILNKVKTIVLDKKEFDLVQIKKANTAAGGLAHWCSAVYKYAEALKVVRPKEAKLVEMEDKFKQAMAQVQEKQNAVEKIKAQVQEMENQLNATVALINRLKKESDMCEQRLLNAGKLISLLKDEGQRWEDNIKDLQEQGQYIAGNVFLATSELSYLGPFSGVYREQMIKKWIEKAEETGLPISPKYSLINTLGDQVEIREWTMSGLPSDQVSIDNAIMATQTARWPLMIDPQSQANTWIKKLAQAHEDTLVNFVALKAITGDQAKMYERLSYAIKEGQTCLLEEVGESMDPSLDGLFTKSTFPEDGLTKIKFGDKSIEFNPEFRLFLTSKIQNPHFLPETCIKLTVINFSITFEGLEDQMLVDVIKNEAPEVEEERDQLIVKLAQSRNDLYKLQSKILTELAESNADTILDNLTLIETLEICNTESIEIAAALVQAEQIELQINDTRNKYRVTAKRGSLIYFTVVELSQIDPMYQNSLVYVKQLFNEAIRSVKKTDSMQFEQIINLHLGAITDQLYRKICVGLFETHKLIFAFLICTRIKRQAGNIEPKEWATFYKGADLSQLKEQEGGMPKWLLPQQWAESSVIPELQEEIKKNSIEWKMFANSSVIAKFPKDFQVNLTPFQRLLVVKILKQEVLQYAVQHYLKEELGNQFAVSPTSSLDQLFTAGDCYVPIIFILSQGVDPISSILNYCRTQEMQDRFYYKSLGQGQEKIAAEMIRRGREEGNWVLLQNCHLFKSWMSTLESICAELASREVECHPEFKLILTSMPVDYFPISVLQNSLKMTTDPPKGIKANLKRTYQNIITQDLYEETLQKSISIDAANQTQYSQISGFSEIDPKKLEEKRRCFKLLVFSLAFFHAVIQERKKFGPLGWNILYEFSDADLDTSILMLKNFMIDNVEIPWDSIRFMTGQINFGGRVTDFLDQTLLMSMLQIYQCEEIVITDAYRFSPGTEYRCPPHTTLQEANEYIASLPDEDPPEIFGMHKNANIIYQRAKSQLLIDTICSVQPREYTKSGEGQKSSDEIVIEMAELLLTQVPEAIPTDNYAKEILKPAPNGLLSCFSTVLLQELQRYNKLINKLNTSLELLVKAVKGIVLMSSEMDLMFTALIGNQVPQNWKNVSYPSLKKLTSWIADLNQRVEFMRKWALKGHPRSYWLSGFFFPHGFITGVLQTYARKYQQPIDQLKLDFTISKWQRHEEVDHYPEDGVYIFGLFLQNASWSIDKNELREQRPNEMSFLMPVIHFCPSLIEQAQDIHAKFANKDSESEGSQSKEIYSCPVYKTSLRAGVLSTTGQSTNYILSVDLPSSSNEQSKFQSISGQSQHGYTSTVSAIAEGSTDHWTMRGTALLTMLDD